MAIRESLQHEAETKYLATDEHVQAVMWGNDLSPWLYVIGPLANWEYRAVICTNRRILLCRGGPLLATLEGIIESVPRATRIGPPRGIWVHRIAAFDSRVYITRRFFRDIRLADTTATQTAE